MERRLSTPDPIDPVATLSSLRRSARDPVHRVTPDGALWRGTRTPDGPATVRITTRPAERAVRASAWGPGAGWVLERLPGLVGVDDDQTGFDPGLPMLSRLVRRFPGWRVCRTGLVWEALLAAVLEQKVTSVEAWRSWRELTWRFGERAPAPEGLTGPKLWVPPDPRTIAELPSWEWHRAGVGPDRMRTAQRCARVAARLEETVPMPAAEAERRLRTVPGVGVWTAAEVRQRAHGDPDAVSVGDYNLPKTIGWALARQPYDDEQMLAALERWRGHRYRVTRLIEMSGASAPRRGPRLSGRDYRGF